MDSTAGRVLPRLTVRHTRVRGLNLVPEQPMETAAGTMAVTPLALIDVSTEEGITGRSYLRRYTPVALSVRCTAGGEPGRVARANQRAPAVAGTTLRGHARLLVRRADRMALARPRHGHVGRAGQGAVPLATLLGGEPRRSGLRQPRTMRPEAAADEAGEAVTPASPRSACFRADSLPTWPRSTRSAPPSATA